MVASVSWGASIRGGVLLASVLLASDLASVCVAQPTRGAIPVTLHTRAGTHGIVWPLTFGVPFPDELLRDEEAIRLLDPDGNRVQIQVRATARWKSGFLRWVLIDTQQPLPHDKAAYTVVFGEEPLGQANREKRVTIEHVPHGISVNTGPLQFTLATGSLQVFSDVQLRGEDGRMRSVFPAGSHADVLIEDGEGTVFRGSQANAPEVVIEEAGPLRVSVKLEGWMQAVDGRKLGRRIVRVQAFAGMRWLRVYDTWVNTADTNDVSFRNIAFHLPYTGNEHAFQSTSHPEPRVVTKCDYLLQHEHDKYEIVSDGEVVSTGRRSAGRVTVGSKEAAFTVGVRHFWQMCPNEIEINPGVLKVHIWPKHGKTATHGGRNLSLDNLGHLWWVHEGEVLNFRNPPELYERHFKSPAQQDAASRANAFGIAVTSEYLLDFHGAASDSAAILDTRDGNPVFVVDPQWLADSGAFWNIAPWREPYLEVERAAAAPLDFFVAMYDRLGDYGKWNFGAYHKAYHPTLDGARLHRHWMAFHHGGSRWPWLVFARSGNPRYLDFAEINARHCMDVATCNWEDIDYNRRYYNPAHDSRSWLSLKFLGGLCKYNSLVHWNAGGQMGYNSEVDYALWYYYMTGYQRAWDVAMNHGECLLRYNDPMPLRGQDPLDPVVTKGRNGTARGAAAVALYRATHDQRYLELAERQMRYFRDALDKDESNAWQIMYAPFVERYYEVTEDKSLEPYIVRWARYWQAPPTDGSDIRVANALPGREHWYLRDTFYGILALGYRLTGDASLLEYGVQQARLFLETRGAGADPVLDDVPLFNDYPGVAGYTAQQFGHFVKALEEHEQKTGRLLALPDAPDTPMIATPVRSRRLVFYVRKEAGEEVHIPFTFTTAPNTVTIWNPRGDRVVKNREIAPETKNANYDFALPADTPAGEYRVEFNSALLTASWPPQGARFKKLVMERPDHIMSGVRITFMPRVSRDGTTVKVRLMTYARPKDFQTHRLYKPDGSIALAKTLQSDSSTGKGDTYLVGELDVAPRDQGKPWVYTRMMYGNGWIEGDVYPVYAFRPSEFFVPERFK